MMSKIFLVIVLTFLSLTMKAQVKTDTMTHKSLDIEKVIELKKSDKKQQTLLIAFKKRYQMAQHILVVEFQNYYELTVIHPDLNGFTGGAEGYTLNKSTKALDMIWHEHPMKLPKLKLHKKGNPPQ